MRGELICLFLDTLKINTFKGQFDTGFRISQNEVLFYRIDHGEAMLLNANIAKAKYKNRHHFSKEALVVLHTSQVVVQGSPLLVIILSEMYP